LEALPWLLVIVFSAVNPLACGGGTLKGVDDEAVWATARRSAVALMSNELGSL